MKKFLFSLILIVLFVTACSSGAPGPVIEAKDAWVRAAGSMHMDDQDKSKMESGSPEGEMDGMGMNSAAYMILVNKGDKTDRLIRVEGDVSQVIEIHETQIVGDVMSMQQIEFIEVPAKGQATLEPGGKHIMLIGLIEELNAGDNVPLKLVFETAGEMLVEAVVKMP
jgi:copper(I)-binding protein